MSSIPGLIKEGRFLENDDEAGIVIGAVLARNLRVGVGDELTLLGSGRDGSFAAAVVDVVGIFESGIPDIDRNFAEMPLGLFQDVFFMEGAGHQLVISAATIEAAELQMPQVSASLPVDTELVVHDWDALQPGLKQAIQADMSSAFFMYGILVILVAFSVLNTQLMSVLERTHEFGIVMSLGLRPGRLGRLVMLETALMGLMGLVIGAITGTIFTTWVTVTGLSIPGMEEMAGKFNLPGRIYPQLSAIGLMLGPAIVLVSSVVATVYPALRLRWMEPVAAMRAAGWAASGLSSASPGETCGAPCAGRGTCWPRLSSVPGR